MACIQFDESVEARVRDKREDMPAPPVHAVPKQKFRRQEDWPHFLTSAVMVYLSVNHMKAPPGCYSETPATTGVEVDGLPALPTRPFSFGVPSHMPACQRPARDGAYLVSPGRRVVIEVQANFMLDPPWHLYSFAPYGPAWGKLTTTDAGLSPQLGFPLTQHCPRTSLPLFGDNPPRDGLDSHIRSHATL